MVRLDDKKIKTYYASIPTNGSINTFWIVLILSKVK